jgi:hypothetical protein
MKVYKKNIQTGNIIFIDKDIIANNTIEVTKREYELQRSNRYLRAKSNLDANNNIN